jgi:Fur family ferric uptake transcriptional regulator
MGITTAEFATQLRSQGYRLTPQRHLILEAVRRAGRHVTPEQVYETVHRQNPAISRATIYRTLDFLCEMRLIHALFWGGQMYYEIMGDEPHDHLICRTCGAIEPCDHALLVDLFSAVAKKHHFNIDTDHVALFGECEHCRSTARKARKR